MNILYLGPLRRAVARMRSLLFTPFRIETWLTVGFAAFLSEWLCGGWGQGGWQNQWRHGGRVGVHGPAPDLHDLLPALVWGPLLAGLIVVGIAIAILFLWLGTRGKFVFLDNVVRGRAAIVEPWNRLKRLGNSLFLWQLVFGILASLVVLAVVFGTIGTAVLGWLGFREPVAMAPSVIGGFALLLFLGLLIGFVELMLSDFVVPIMYRHDLTATEAWRRFLPLLREHVGHFVLYALMVLVLFGLFVGAVTLVGFATCCVGFFFMLMPYVGQVVLLPVYVAYRGFGPEFLAQFGPDFDAFAGVPPAQPAPPPAPAPGANA